ncbi:recombinase family protein [Streptomyces sp. NPDC088124]|uniref:recombinase family protein n=1 Tax=Streptomyces sp. NPDC088124 TaxID=3154654 RepID=UPI0034344FAE
MALKTLPRHAPAVIRAGIYCRLSYAPDGSEEKVDRQEADCRELAVRLRWSVSDLHIFRDNSRSAWQRTRRRPGWERMLEAIEAGEIDAIIVYHGDRLIRQPYDLERLIAIADQKGIRVASISGTRDLDSADDRFILRIEAAQACKESDNTSRRVRRGILARAKKGRARPGGVRAFGWGLPSGEFRRVTDPDTGEERDVEVLDMDKLVPKETRLLREVAERILAGMSKRAALRWMNKRCTTTRGNAWTQRTLTAALTAWRMAGLVAHQGSLYEAVWDEVYPLEMLEDLRALFAQNLDEYGYHGRARVHLLTGIGECSDCHAPDGDNRRGSSCTSKGGARTCKATHQTFSYKPTGRYRIYYCEQCQRGRREENLDAYVEGAVLRLLNSEPFLAELEASAETSGTPGLGAEIAALERRRAETVEQLKNLADHPNVDPTLAAEMLASFDLKLAGLRGSLRMTSKVAMLRRVAGFTREQWAAECVDVRAEVTRSLYRIVMHPTAQRGPGFDPTAIELIRRPLEPVPVSQASALTVARTA